MKKSQRIIALLLAILLAGGALFSAGWMLFTAF